MDDLSEEERVFAYSIQGLANRKKPTIYLLYENQTHLLDFYKEQGYVKRVNTIESLKELYNSYDKVFRGVVIYDLNSHYETNLATNIASVEERLMLSEALYQRVRSWLPKGVDVLSIKSLNLSTPAKMFDWYLDNIYPQQSHQALSIAANHYMNNIYRDYLIAFKIPTFWLPSPNDADYSEEYEKCVFKMFEMAPANIPVLGFWPSRGKGGKNGKIGNEEYFGVKLGGEYGKFTVVSTWVGNYSYHSGVGKSDVYEQTKVRAKAAPEYDKNTKYVALIMIESGDAAGYMLSTFRKYQWEQANRERVPISYGINPSMQYLMPAFTKYYYDSASENNFFFNSISGAGYCYLFEDYGVKTASQEQTFKEYARLTQENMRKMDLDMLGLYTHPTKMMSSSDIELLERFSQESEDIDSYVLGMHRVDGYNASNSHGTLSTGATHHHTITMWPPGNVEGQNKAYESSDESKDDFTVQYMVDEIRRNSGEGQFMQAMFYSWFYGSRRLAKVQDILEREGYKFVTMNHFDELYRESIKK